TAGVLTWALGLLVAAGVAFAGWLVLQPPWRRWRWWGNLKKHLRRRRGRERSGTTTSTWARATASFTGGASSRSAVDAAGSAIRAIDAEVTVDGPSPDAPERGVRVAPARRKRKTDITLPVIPVRPKKR
ncbi:MAG: hypothetical protein ACYS9X_30275, partial [Planctomycetota bacterium]